MDDTAVSDPVAGPGDDEGGAGVEADGPTARTRRSRLLLVLLGGVVVLVAYYALAVFALQADDSGLVDLVGPSGAVPDDRIDLEVEGVEVDPSVGTFAMQLLPVAEGGYKGSQPGQLREPLQVQVSSPGQPAAVFDFPAGQLLDPVTATVTTRGRARGFPFDQTRIELGLTATSGDEAVPVQVEMTDATEGWDLAGSVRPRGDGSQLDLDADRELLPITFSLMYVAGTVVVALITVAVIGGAIAHGRVDFSQVIWLGAMLVAIPAVRNEMPGVPPIGTAVDLFVFLPSVVVVALALVGAIVVLVGQEAAAVSAPGDAGAPASDDRGVSVDQMNRVLAQEE